ncbi:MAG: cytochrome c [Methylococcales bacterium]|jgi:mono/diheme cytochrome c family protein|nr:cytochrome c [Methylococcales bacterium]MBT7443776.1 cytochrome c [Methylococcales bacterium]
MKTFLLLATSLLVLAACNKPSTYQPAAGDSSETIYADACARCHNPFQPGKPLGIVKSLNPNAQQVANKIQVGGTMVMPAFEQIPAERRLTLAQWIIDNN